MKKLMTFLAASLLSVSAQAATLDFTAAATSSAGTIDGVGYTLSTNVGSLNSSEAYDGTLTTGAPTLALEVDGVGINNDETDGREVLTLTFDSAMYVSALYFLDLYTSDLGTEKVIVKFDNVVYGSGVDAVETSPQGGFASLDNLALWATVIELTAAPGVSFIDDTTNDFALAGVEVSAVPVPAAAFLMAPALLGFMGLRRKADKKA